MSRALRDSRGFSLIEVLAALFILGVSAATVLGVFSTNMRLIRKSGDHINATIQARSMLEEAMTVDDITRADGIDTRLLEPYTGRVEVLEMPGGEEGVEIYEIIATVEWPPSGSVTLRGRRAVVNIE